VATIREQLLSAVEASLNHSTGRPANLTVHRERTWPIERDTLPSILVFAQDEPEPVATTKEKFHAPLVERSLTLNVECRAQGSPPDAALDPITLWATLRMFADEKFAGLAIGVTEGKTTWNSKFGETPIAAANIFFTIAYRTLRVDPSRQV
jgi:hypothetical protein